MSSMEIHNLTSFFASSSSLAATEKYSSTLIQLFSRERINGRGLLHYFFNIFVEHRDVEEKAKATPTRQTILRPRIRMRKWGKWVAEIREPNKQSRICLGSYSSHVAAMRAYDTALFYLRGPSARLNILECTYAQSDDN